MKPPVAPPDPKHPDMSPEAIDQRLRDLAQIYKLGMSLRDAKWLGPITLKIITRLMGLMLAAVAFQFIINAL